MNIPIITPLVDSVPTIAKHWLDVKKVKAEGKVKIQQALIEKELQNVAKKEDYDIEANKGMRYSWKDEYFVLILSFPFIGSFIPHIQDYMLQGWEYLSKAPDWYRWAFLASLGASFGVRWGVKGLFPWLKQ
jgi:hypothetical protein